MKPLLISAVSVFFGFLNLAIIIRAIISWFRPQGYSKFHKFYSDLERALDVLTEPIIAPIRRFIPPVGPGVDFSPLVAIILLQFVETLVMQILNMLF